MTKKLFALLITLTIISTSSAFADCSSLPQNARNFIQKVYPNVKIWKAERDDGKFEVKLSNGSKIDFLYNGEWNSIDGEYNTVPFSALPQSLANTIKNTYSNAVIIEIEKEWGNYKVKLNNFMELFITPDGQLMGQKFDD
ncbi:PepSY-like domain-containing protein [Brachyspira murdochii]|uniref:Putative beta-lactamase-inhibitor-like PepSY-like domain-containing protein n=1 Tax=Brachyspira murdochii (strain ATCC 51284 / DSM 12563 / 56-150) TaxID=526224 RepID=D5U418_BRAM5|nr:PepSY-like domain-containing protein [Brachyspira murdochii]ADG72199.1 conserved hypothetical protein [Brachyspira murdochii DSM 12563]